MNNNQNGFSVIELLIVTLVISIIAAIAIPNLMAARRTANESSAVTSLRTLHTAQMTYRSSAGAGKFAGTITGSPNITGLTELNTKNLIDPVLASGIKNGFSFEGDKVDEISGNPSTFYIYANPVIDADVNLFTGTGHRCFGVITDGSIRFASLGDAVSFTDQATIMTGTVLAN